jgi:hypothetical protein
MVFKKGGFCPLCGKIRIRPEETSAGNEFKWFCESCEVFETANHLFCMDGLWFLNFEKLDEHIRTKKILSFQ